VVTRIINAVGVAEQRTKHRTQLEQLVPVSARSGQATHFNAQHDAHMSQRDFSQQTLKSSAPFNRSSTDTQVLINHFDPLPRPAQRGRAIDEPILHLRRLDILFDLLGARLANVDDCQPLEVRVQDLVTQASRDRPGLGCSGGA
jgi:hypothetical protein